MTTGIKGTNLKAYIIWLIAYAAVVIACFFAPVALLALPFLMPLMLQYSIAHSDKRMVYLFASAAIAICLISHFPQTLLIAATCFAAVLIAAGIMGGSSASFKSKVLLWSCTLGLGALALVYAFTHAMGPDPANGMGDWAVKQLQSMPNGSDVLWRLYGNGYLRLNKDLLESQIAVNGMMSFIGQSSKMLTPVRDELLKGVYTLAKNGLPQFIATWVTLYVLAGGLLLALIPVIVSRHRGIKIPDPKPFAMWRMSRAMGRFALCMGAGRLISVLIASRAALILGTMLGMIFTVTFVLQGLAVNAYTQKKSGMSVGGRYLWMIVTVLVFHWLPLFIGVADYFADFRQIDAKNEEEDK